MPRSPHLAAWTGPEVFQECRTAYRAYASAKTESYRAYFAARPELKDEHHPYKAVIALRRRRYCCPTALS